MKFNFLIAFALFSILLAGCAPTPSESEGDGSKVAPSAEVQATAFESKELGFKMQIPAEWQLQTQLEDATWASGTVPTLYFRTQDGTDIFAVTRFTLDEWAQVEAEEGPQPTEIVRNDEYVWTQSQTQDPSGVEAEVEQLPALWASFSTNL
jgi:hypothetical protein